MSKSEGALPIFNVLFVIQPSKVPPPPFRDIYNALIFLGFSFFITSCFFAAINTHLLREVSGLFSKCWVIYASLRSRTLTATSLLIDGLLRMPQGCYTPQFTGAGHGWEQMALSANPLALIGAKGVSRWPALCCTVGRL